MGIALPGAGGATRQSVASGAQVIDGSLCFDQSKNQHLKRTPSSASNRRTWTWSGWAKRSELSSSANFFASYGGSLTEDTFLQMYLSNADIIRVISGAGGSTERFASSAVFRDTSSWYHFVFACDTTQSTAADRFKVYVNGSSVTKGSGTDFPQNTNTAINNNIAHYHATYNGTSEKYDGYLSNVYFIDGQQLGPESFGYTDPLTNTWRPKKYTGNLKSSSSTIPDAFTYWTGMDQNWSSGGSTSAGNDYINQALPSSGKVYWEVTLNSPDIYRQIGIAQGASGTGTGYNDNIFGFYYNGNPPIWLTKNSSADDRGDAVAHGATTGTNWNDGDKLMFAWDADNDKIWFGLNGTWYADGDPTNGTNPIISGEDLSANSHYFKQGRTDGNNTTTLTNITSGSASYFSGLNTIYVNRNTFYLPFDGNSPIGEDKTGNGNDWTPVNFGGSVALPKATGAKPILNTDGGGNVARSGVFGSEENQFVTVTVASKTGGGNAYFFGGVERDSLASLRGTTVTFNTTDSTNNTHPFKLSSTNADSSGGTEYTDGVAYYINGSVTTGSDYVTNYSTGAASGFRGIKWTVPHNVSTTYYYCTVHNGMGENGRLTSTTDETKADPYAWKNILALPLVGTSSDVSNSVNSGSTTKAITAQGNAAASSTKSNFYGGSFVFDGTGDYLTTPDSADFDLAGNDFTIEAFVYHSSTNFGSYESVIGQWSDSSTGSFVFETAGGGSTDSIDFYYVDTSNNVVGPIAGIALQKERWHHIAVCRSGSSIRIFVDGVGTTASSISVNIRNSSDPVTMGGQVAGSGGYWNGYIQDLRVYNGVAKYTSNFIPASTNPNILPDTPSGVSGGSKLAKVTDGAVSFDGSGSDYLVVGDGVSTDLAPGTGVFTIEFYLYPKTVITSAPGILQWSATNNTQTSYTNAGFVAWNSTGSITLQLGASSITTGAGKVPMNKWSHIAIQRSTGNEFRLYVDGILITSDNSTLGNPDTSSKYLVLGKYYTGNNYALNGFISNFRLIKGTALYTTNFTPPTRKLTNVTNTKLLCCQSNTLAGSAAVSPNISGTNDGTVWSRNYTSTSGFNASYPPSYAFNGSVSNYAEPVDTGSTMTVTFNPPLVVSGDFDVKISSTGELFTTINGGTSTSKGSGLNQYHTLGSDITVSNFTYTSSTRPVLYSVRINGSTILVDPVTTNGDAAATNFNPFTTDINAVRGQETGYCTLNPLRVNEAAITLSNGNLTASRTGSNEGRVAGTMTLSTGKFYFEVTRIRISSVGNYFAVGVTSMDNLATTQYGGNPTSSGGSSLEWVLTDRATAVNSSTYTNLNSTLGNVEAGDVVQVCIDMDTSKIWFGKNGIFSGAPQNGSGQAFSNLPSEVTPLCYLYSEDLNWNFGQKPFKFPPPAGFQPLNTANVKPVKVFARPDQYVGVTTYTGNATARRISDYNFKPDLVWCKLRGTSGDNILQDTVRGTGVYIRSNSTGQNVTDSNYITSFNRDGFSVGTANPVNQNDQSMVAWGWKAGGNKNTFNKDDVGYASAAAAGITEGTISLTGASIGTKQGFSIIKYTGNSAASASIGHGLTQAPKFIICKNIGITKDWVVYTETVGPGNTLYLNKTDQSGGGTGTWGNVSPTSTVFSVGSNSTTNYSGPMIAYCWHDVPGLQKFGSYEGNGDADGPFIELGFRPAVVLTKNVDASDDWSIADSSRSPHNVAGESLRPNSSAQEDSSADIDILSNGFKIRQGNSHRINYDAETFIYAAWAEAPAFNLFGAQSNAR